MVLYSIVLYPWHIFQNRPYSFWCPFTPAATIRPFHAFSNANNFMATFILTCWNGFLKFFKMLAYCLKLSLEWRFRGPQHNSIYVYIIIIFQTFVISRSELLLSSPLEIRLGFRMLPFHSVAPGLYSSGSSPHRSNCSFLLFWYFVIYGKLVLGNDSALI